MIEIFKNLEAFQQNQFISAAIDRAGVGIVISDPGQYDDPIIYVNKGFEELTGYAATEIIGKNCRFLQRDSNDQDKHKVSKMKQAIDSNREIRLTIKNFKKNGTAFWNDLHIYPLYIEDLKRDFFIGIQRDISEEIEAKIKAEKHLKDVMQLSTPIIPITDSVSVVPLLGKITEERLQYMMEKIGEYIEKERTDYLIIDLSGIETFSDEIHMAIQSLQKLLTIMGSNLIVTGVTPALALASVKGQMEYIKLTTYTTVKEALAILQQV